MPAEPAARPLGVVLTAGAGTRLRPLTPALPKSLVPLLNRPLIAYALDAMRDLGIDEVVVVVGGGDEATGRAALDIAPSDLHVSVAVQDEPRGPGDAVISAGKVLDGRPVVVLAVDAVLPGLDRAPLEAFMRSDAVAGLVLKAVDDPRSFGVAIVEEGRVTHLEEKPEQPRSNLALVGLWLLRPEAIERVRTRPVINAKGESDLTATVATFVDDGREVLGWEFPGDWLDGGTLEGLLQAQAALLPRLAPGALEAAAAAASLSSTALEGPVLLGADALVEGCRLDRTVVGAGAQLRNVVLRHALVVPGARLEGGDYQDVVVTADGQVVGPGAPSEG